MVTSIQIYNKPVSKLFKSVTSKMLQLAQRRISRSPHILKIKNSEMNLQTDMKKVYSHSNNQMYTHGTICISTDKNNLHDQFSTIYRVMSPQR
jgi:hypothetical protein